MRIKAAAYLRMSTDKQETSIDQQREGILTAFSEKYEIVEWYIDEGKSGSRDVEKRTDFLRMLADATKGRFEVVLVYDLSRFDRRDTFEQAADKKTLRDHGVRLTTILEGEIDWNTSTGRIVDTVLSEAQHDFSVRLGNKTLCGKLKTFKEGKPFGQLTPYGLARLVVDNNGKETVVERTQRFKTPKTWKQKYIPGDDQEKATVCWLFNEFDRRDVSFHKLARELNEKSIPSPSGGKWVYQTVKEILTNVRYVGDLSLGRDGAGKFFRLEGDKVIANSNPRMQTGRQSALIMADTHEGIIERPLFDRVQVKVKRRWRSGKHSGSDEGFALTGIVYCASCGKPLYGNDGRKRTKTFKGIRYNCKGEHRSPDSECRQWGVREQFLLPFLLDTLIEQIDRIELINIQPRKASSPQGNVGDLERRRQKLEGEYATGMKRFLGLEDKALASDVEKVLSGKKAEIERLDRQIAEQNSEKSTHRREWQKWWQERRADLIYVRTARFSGGRADLRYSSGVDLTPSTIRELLEKIGARVDLWWSAESKPYRVVRGRLRAGEHVTELPLSVLNGEFEKSSICPTLAPNSAAHFESLGLPMVRCACWKNI